jgi:hypothetical protein
LLSRGLYLLLGGGLSSSLSLQADKTFPQHRGISKSKNPCPVHCNVAGPIPSDWSVYHSLDNLQKCQQAIFLDFSIHSQIHDPETLPRIRACTVRGADWERNPTIKATPGTAVNVTYELGWWNTDGSVQTSCPDVFSLIKQFQIYFENGYGATNQSALVFGKSGNVTLGIYLGKALQNEGTAGAALKNLASFVSPTEFSGGLAMQLCVSTSILYILSALRSL